MYNFLFFILFISSLSAQNQPVDYVNPFIGSVNSGNTFPGAVIPWGMVSVSPHNSPGSPSGYVKGKENFYGFGHSHLSGTGCADLGSIIVTASRARITDDAELYKMKYSGETTGAGYYSVKLDAAELSAEVTAEARSGMIRFRAESDGEINIIFDLGRSLAITGGGSVNLLPGSRLEGSNTSGGFCGETNRQTVYFASELSMREEMGGKENFTAGIKNG